MILVYKNHIFRKKNGISYNEVDWIMDREETSVKAKKIRFSSLRNQMKADNFIFKDSGDFLIFSLFYVLLIIETSSIKQ